MSKHKLYWLGKRPSNGKRWAYTTSAIVLDEEPYHEKLYRMYRRYVKQWNDIELNVNRGLSEHKHEVLKSQIVGGLGRCFTLHWQDNHDNHWILEIFYARSFSEYYSGWSCGRNPFRTIKGYPKHSPALEG